MSASSLPDWERLLSAAAHLQEILPGATLVGGTAAAIFAGHRVSYDAVLRDAVAGLQAAYQFGSSALGKTTAGSDIDLAALTATPLPPDLRGDLQSRLSSTCEASGANPLALPTVKVRGGVACGRSVFGRVAEPQPRETTWR